MKGITELKANNRNTTVKSLEAVFIMLTTKNKNEFIKAYEEATHDDAGGSCWFYMTSKKS